MKTPCFSYPAEMNEKLEAFRLALENLCNEKMTERFPKLAEVEKISIYLEPGQKFVRVVNARTVRETGQKISASAHCFVNLENGDVLKCAGWKAPEKKNPRGNIFGDDILKGVTEYGVIYLR